MVFTDTFYKDAQKFVLNRIITLDASSLVDKLEILHSVIADERVCINNWKSLVDAYIYAEMCRFKGKISIGEKIPKIYTERRYCRYCDEMYSQEYFASGFNKKTNCWQYRSICKNCYKNHVKKSEKYIQKTKEYYKKYRIKNREKLLQNAKLYRQTYIDKTARERYLRWKEKKQTLNSPTSFKFKKTKE